MGITVGNSVLAYLYIRLAMKQDWESIAYDVSVLIESYLEMQTEVEDAWKLEDDEYKSAEVKDS